MGKLSQIKVWDPVPKSSFFFKFVILAAILNFTEDEALLLECRPHRHLGIYYFTFKANCAN